METLVDTTFSGKDISSALTSVYEYTANADRVIQIQLRFAAVAGNGDYTVLLSLNDGDAQTDDYIEPRTTTALDSGQTACWFLSVWFAVKNGDVVNVFALGQAGDTSESGSIRVFGEDYAVAGDAMDLIADAVDANALAADAVSEIQSGLSTLTAQQVWEYATRTLTSFGTLVADIWAGVTAAFFAKFFTQDSGSTYGASVAGSVVKEIADNAGGTSLTEAGIADAVLDELLSGHTTDGSLGETISSIDTKVAALDTSDFSVVSAVNGGEVTQFRDSKIYFQLTDIGSLAGRTALYFTVKYDLDYADTSAIIKIEETAGLQVLNGSSDVTAVNGALTVDVEADGDVTVSLDASDTDNLPVGTFPFDIKIIRASEPTEYPIAQGRLTIKRTATKAVS